MMKIIDQLSPIFEDEESINSINSEMNEDGGVEDLLYVIWVLFPHYIHSKLVDGKNDIIDLQWDMTRLIIKNKIHIEEE